MNYLAHIFLSGNNRGIQIGNFVGDAVKGANYRHYPARLQQGILLHRKIDVFSDSHPLVREAVGLGRPLLGRYSAVVIDIFFDHFLAVNFRNYSGVSLNYFAFQFYMALLIYYPHLPSRFQGFLWHFILTNRLVRYASVKGIRQSLEIMATYRGLQVNPSEAAEFLISHYSELETLFRNFFPELMEMCQSELLRPTTHILNS